MTTYIRQYDLSAGDEIVLYKDENEELHITHTRIKTEYIVSERTLKIGNEWKSSKSRRIEMEEKIIVNPDPKRMAEGLRDTGYSFNTSVADLIDNSIAAESQKNKDMD